jgi:hypothetical protein
MNKRAEKIKARLIEFRDKRELAKRIAADVKEDQPEILATMKNIDPMNAGITFDETDSSKGTAYYQQNNPSEYWDEEAIQDYIKGKSALRKSVTTSVLDMRKWEAEVAAGNVPPKIASKFKKMGTTPAPFIRFGKKGENSA